MKVGYPNDHHFCKRGLGFGCSQTSVWEGLINSSDASLSVRQYHWGAR